MRRNIQMVDLKNQYLKIKNEIDGAIEKVLSSTAYINGPEVEIFAENLKKYTNANFVIPCANGTDALQIALMALGLKPGDEVIVPVHTYVATAEVIALLNLKPIFIDVNKNDFLINVSQIERLITKKTKAIVPVHLYGQCADMETILEIAKKYNLFVVEDTAQAIGAIYTFKNGNKMQAGTMGDIGTTSFFPSKNLGCYGDGGALFVKNQQIAGLCKIIANHGQQKKYYHDVVGCNSRLDTIQAAILNVKLNYLDKYSKARNEVAQRYDQVFKDISELETPVRLRNSTHVFHQYTLRVDKKISRDLLKDKLQEAEIPSMIYYPVPLHLQKAYSNPSFPKGSFPISEELSETVLSIPIHTEMTLEEQSYIIEMVKKSIKELIKNQQI